MKQPGLDDPFLAQVLVDLNEKLGGVLLPTELFPDRVPSYFDGTKWMQTELWVLKGDNRIERENGTPLCFLAKSKNGDFNRLGLYLPPFFRKAILVVREVDAKAFNLPAMNQVFEFENRTRPTYRAKFIDSFRCKDLLGENWLQVFVLEAPDLDL